MAEPDTPTSLPPPATRSPDRLQTRPYEERWALLPPSETDGQLAPGAGPHGTISTSGVNVAMVLLAAAFAVLFLVFFVPALPVLVLGLALFALAIVTFAVREHHVGTGHGVGTLRPKLKRALRPASRGAQPES